MTTRLTFVISLLLFSFLGYWGHDLPRLNEPAEASSTAGIESEQVIEKATALAYQSRYLDAIELLQIIPSQDSHFAQATELQNRWGEALLVLGKSKLSQGKHAEAKAILESVPKTTQAHTEAAELLK